MPSPCSESWNNLTTNCTDTNFSHDFSILYPDCKYKYGGDDYKVMVDKTYEQVDTIQDYYTCKQNEIDSTYSNVNCAIKKIFPDSSNPPCSIKKSTPNTTCS